ncbi:sensor histidine kinase [Acerihabitans arboris]|uniref:Sensor histidine kinase DcuS n=1 Tax=Acerihabitans arboris TaxID=2691583 RepID=A0A845SEH0_9GAMM|nr:sensor histidine kinase [Acerihabitans arboris]NDL62259.1 two-component system sensor histidine kinase DcuS [Acerihabitans arboris]
MAISRRKTPLTLSTSVILMVSGVIVSVLVVVHMLFFSQISELAENNVRDKAFAIARTLALDPEIVQGLSGQGKTGAIQQVAEAARIRNDLFFIVITDMNRIRFSHPNAELLGKVYVGDDILPALQARENQAINLGTLGRALRIYTPVYDAARRQIGVVAIGISLDTVQAIVNGSRWNLLWTALIGAIVGGMGTWLLVKALKRIMLGFEPYEIARLFEERNAMLQSVKEGVIAVDADGQITLINDEAKRLFKQHGPWENLLLDAASKHWPAQLFLRNVLQTGKPQRDRESHINGSVLLTNTVPVIVNGDIVGAIATFRDKTEVARLLERLDGMSAYADTLRVQSHEFMNKLHVILGMLHLKSYRALESYILKTANNYQNEIGTLIRIVKSPVIAGFLLGKINRARDLDIGLVITEDSWLPDTDDNDATACLITVLGNVIENAMDALADRERGTITVSFLYRDDMLLECTVIDDGPGINPAVGDTIFQRGFSTKGTGRGIGLYLARQGVERLGGWVKFTSEPGVSTRFDIMLPYRIKTG